MSAQLWVSRYELYTYFNLLIYGLSWANHWTSFLKVKKINSPINKVPGDYEGEPLGEANKNLTIKYLLSLNQYTNERHCIYYLKSIRKKKK